MLIAEGIGGRIAGGGAAVETAVAAVVGEEDDALGSGGSSPKLVEGKRSMVSKAHGDAAGEDPGSPE